MRKFLALTFFFCLLFILHTKDARTVDQNTIAVSPAPDSSPSGVLHTEPKPELVDRMVGLASYYSDNFIGKTRACGGQFSQEEQNAAHRWLPCGTRVRVTNLGSGQTTVVNILDRGPFINGRVVDLSKQSFSEITATSSGLVKVKLEILN